MAKKAKKVPYRFKEIREESEVTLEALADMVGISISQLSRFESGDREPRVRELLRVADALKRSWRDFIDGEDGSERLVPLLSWVSAGKLQRAPTVEVLEDALGLLRVPGLPDGDWIALKVDGTSMDRISPPESTIFVNRKEKRLVPNACYVIADPEEGSTYKRYRPEPMRFEPVTFTEGHKTIFPDQEPVVIGRVKRTVLDL